MNVRAVSNRELDCRVAYLESRVASLMRKVSGIQRSATNTVSKRGKPNPAKTRSKKP